MSEHAQPREWTLKQVAFGPGLEEDAPCEVIELNPMLDMIERLMSPHFEVREDAGADAIRLLRAHGKLGQPVASPDEGAELEEGWA
jgi:hypothetical protein